MSIFRRVRRRLSKVRAVDGAGGLGLGFLALCVLFGGASQSGLAQTMMLQVIACGVMLIALWRAWSIDRDGPWKGALFLFAALIGVGAIQLIPLPPWLWSAIPGRAELAQRADLMELSAVWMPLSLAPMDTVRGLFRFLPPIALFGLMIMANREVLSRGLPWMVALLGILSSAIGFLQIFGGPDSWLYFYDPTNRGNATGLFANVNHQSSFLLMALPFVAVLLARWADTRRQDPWGNARGGVIFVMGLTLVTGVLAAGSFAGYLMLGPVLIACFAILQTPTSETRGGTGSALFRGLALIGLVCGAVALGYLLVTSPLLPGLGVTVIDQSDLSRPQIFERTGAAIGDHFPFGSGLGSFEAVYPAYEDPSVVTATYVNHAHNEYLQIFLEFGIFGPLILLAALALWGRQTLVIWWGPTGADRRLRRAASVALGVVILHSIVDYPLRTAATAGVAAVAAAVLTAPASRRPVRTEPALKQVVL